MEVVEELASPFAISVRRLLRSFSNIAILVFNLTFSSFSTFTCSEINDAFTFALQKLLIKRFLILVDVPRQQAAGNGERLEAVGRGFREWGFPGRDGRR